MPAIGHRSGTFSVQMLATGEGDVPGPELFWMSDWDRWYTLVFQVGVLRAPGVCCLVNTGPADDLEPMNDVWAEVLGERARMRRGEGLRITEQLARIGIDPIDVTHVVLTPLQLYTTSNIHRFPNATICLSERGWIHYHTTHRHPHDRRWNCISKETLVHLVVDAWDRVRLLDDEDEVVPGIRTWWTGGHHRASLAVEIDSTAGTVVISDAFFMYRNVEQDHPIGISENLYEVLNAHARARSVADHVVPLYDPEVFDRYRDGLVAPPE
jgi:hypothetical protein